MTNLLTCICLSRHFFRVTLEISRAACPIHDVTPGPLSATDTCIVWERVVEGVGEQRTKAIRCGACYYSIVLNAHRATSMADTNIVLLLCVSVIFF
jgi:hypothetical protein